MSPLRSHLALFTVNLMYGINYVISKGLMPAVIGANGFIFLRVSGAVLIFWLIYLFKFERIRLRDFGLLAVCGFFGVGLNQLLFFNGLLLTSPVNASIIMVTTPILVLVLSLVFVRQNVQMTQIFGVLLGALGAILFSLTNSGQGFASGSGDLFIFLNAFSYAIYMVLVKPLMNRYNALTVITWVFSFGFLVVLFWPLSTREFTLVDWSSLSVAETGQLIFVVVGVTVLPYLLTVYAMKQVSPTVASVYIYIQPVLATLFIYLFWLLGFEDYTRDLSWIKLACTGLVFLGVYLVIKPKRF